MADTLTPEQRRRCMSRVRGKNTSPEVKLRKALWHRGLRYRLNSKVRGKPDFVFVKPRIAIFVDGCFWHGCPIHGEIPKTNADFWEKKISRNKRRDIEVTEGLQESGWVVLRFWTHDLKGRFDSVVETIAAEIASKTKGKSEQNNRR